MQELTDLFGLLGEELAEFVDKNNIYFNTGYIQDPNRDTLRILTYTVNIISENDEFQVGYHPGIRFFSRNLFDKVEIPEHVNGQHRALAEIIGNLMKKHGSVSHPYFKYLPSQQDIERKMY